MRSFFVCLVVPTLSQDVFLASKSTMTTMEPKMEFPSGWQHLGASSNSEMLELTFAVKQQNTEQLANKLLAMSSPTSPQYGKHLSNTDVHKLVAPLPEHLSTVMTFLSSHGLMGDQATPNGDMVVAKVSVEVAEKILSTKYHRLANPEHGQILHCTLDGYSLPAEVADAVDFVAPTTHIPSPKKRLQAEVPQASGIRWNTPPALRRLYNVEDPEGREVVGSASRNKMAVTAFLGEVYNASALEDFWDKYCQGISCGDGLPKLVGDATNGSLSHEHGGESMLDIETITGIVSGVESEFWGFSGRSPDNVANEPFMKWLQLVSSTSDVYVPLVFSTSYGEDENSWSPAAAQRLNVEFMKAGARGISLLYSTGDQGANFKSDRFVPQTPGSSPWVTGVGGTEPTVGFPFPGSEVATGISSGGFSDYFAMPNYQKDVVASYLQQVGVPEQVSKNAVNVSGRAYPDIAAQAQNFHVTPFEPGRYCGTSCATPAASGIIAALNDARLMAGKSPLGFLNPLLYSLAGSDAFQDITQGTSCKVACGCGCCNQSSDGWPTKVGWDAATGLGTLNYKNLLKVVLDLP